MSTFCRVALIIQIHLQQNRTDLAQKEAQRARKWAQDSLLVNLAEAWIGLREVSNLLLRPFSHITHLFRSPFRANCSPSRSR